MTARHSLFAAHCLHCLSSRVPTAILADVFSATEELQAASRIHRLSQTRQTTVWRIVADQTVEVSAPHCLLLTVCSSRSGPHV
jgi:hypothetical protein